MRNNTGLLESFMPLHEKEWDSRLFIDKAIKGNSEYQLQVIARALSGRHNIRFDPKPDGGHISTIDMKDDKGKYFRVTERFELCARMDKYIFYGNNMSEIWLKIIRFWIVDVTVFPCGGAAFPCERIEIAFKDDQGKAVPEE